MTDDRPQNKKKEGFLGLGRSFSLPFFSRPSFATRSSTAPQDEGEQHVEAKEHLHPEEQSEALRREGWRGNASPRREKNPTSPPTAIKTDAEHAVEGLPGLLLEAETVARAVAAGAHGRRRAGPGESFWQHRPYAFGDPVSAIDWRQSARAADRLYIRQNEWAASASAWFWRDPSRSLDYRSDKTLPTKRRRADVLSLALAMLLTKAGERVGLIGGRPEPYHGRLAPQLLLEALKPDTFEDAPLLPPTRIREGAAVIALSDFYGDLDALEAAAAGYAAQGAKGLLVQIIDPAEAAFPFSGRTEFEDLETSDRLLFGDAGAVRAEYLEAFAKLETRLQTIARSLGWIFIRHQTNAPASDALIAAIAALNGEAPQTRASHPSNRPSGSA